MQHRSRPISAFLQAGSSRLGRSRSRRGACPEGLTMVELLIGVIISVLILFAAVKVLLALLQSDRNTQQELSRKDDMARVLGLMQDEIRSARRTESGSSAAPLSAIDSSKCATAGFSNRRTILILRNSLAGDDISYALATPAANSWRGTEVLLRCGPLYDDSGKLQSGGSRNEQVVLDSLATEGFSVISAAASSGSINRNLQLNLISNASGTSLTSSVNVALNSNTVYGLLSNARDSSCSKASGGCPTSDGEATHWRPSAGETIDGDYNQEDVIYFDGKRSDYQISGDGGGRCVNGYSDESPPANCKVRRGSSGAWITINSGDVLVFTDGEIRLPNP